MQQTQKEKEKKNETSPLDFGHGMLSLFMLDPQYTNLNYGSFGSVPKQIMKCKYDWIQHVELNPDRWFRYELYNEVDKVRNSLANYVGVSASDLVFVENASHGVNAVLRSIQLMLKPGAKILKLDLAYSMVSNTLRFLEDEYKIPIVEVHIEFPTNNSKIIEAVRKALEEDPLIQFASFSHITSAPSIILPVKELIDLCHSKGLTVLIDGAHVVGQIPLNIESLNPDFYVSNGHKWMFTPKGSAFLWVKKDYQTKIFPTTISGGGTGETPFQLQFSYEGTSDYSSYLSFAESLNFRNTLGDQRIMEYIHELAVNGGKLLAEMWGTEKLVDDSMIGSMVNVRIPSENADFLKKEFSKQLLEKYSIYVPVFPLVGTNIWYTRVSAQIFVELSDFQKLGEAVLELLK